MCKCFLAQRQTNWQPIVQTSHGNHSFIIHLSLFHLRNHQIITRSSFIIISTSYNNHPPKKQNLVFNSKAAFFLFLSLSFDISFDRRTAVPVRHLPEDIYTEVCPYVAHPNSYGFVVTFIYYALHIPSHFFLCCQFGIDYI